MEVEMIIGKTTVLLPFDEKYVAIVRTWINHPTVRAGTGTEGPVSDYSHSNWYRRLMDDPTRRCYIIGDGIDEHATPVGLIGLSELNLRSRNAEYWVYIGEDTDRRRGLASEATFLIMDFAFNTLGIHRVYLNVIENNLPALSMYRKFGFFQEGTAREHFYWQGKYLDMIKFSMLDYEFREMQAESGR
jgi:UDP-4-amino-4,6-dideoxy-N-acetyl-beta-L-altrosamine N-acetyltransferase